MKDEISPSLFFQIFGLKPGRGEKRRLAIVRAFIDCIASVGLDNTSFDTIGKKVKMSRTHVAYFFPNRDELIRTAIRFAVATGQEVTVSHVENFQGPEARLKAVVEGPFHWLEKHPKHGAVMLMFYYLCTYDPKYRELQAVIQRMGEERIRACVGQLSDLSPQTAKKLSRNIQALLGGTLQYYFTCDYGIALPKLRDETVKACMDWVALSRSARNIHGK